MSDFGAGSEGGWIQIVYHYSHSRVLVFEVYLIDHQSVVRLTAWCLETRKGESVSKDVDGLKLGEGKVLVVVLVGAVIVGVERVEVDGAGGEEGEERTILARVFEVGL